MNITAPRTVDTVPAGKTGDAMRAAKAVAAGVSSHRKPRPLNRSGVITVCLLAGLSLTLAVPKMLASFHALPAQETVADLLGGRASTAANLIAAAEQLGAAEAWSDTPEHRLDHGLVLLRHAFASLAGPEQEALFAQAEKVTAEGLAASPGEPGAWSRLAWLRHRRGDVQGALAALRLSWLSGAASPSIMVTRLEFALALLDSMDAEMQDLMRRQIRLIWVMSPETVADLALRPGLGDLVRLALDGLSEQDIARHLELHGPKP